MHLSHYAIIKMNGVWADFWILLERIRSWVCLLRPGLKLFVHLKNKLFILLKSSFKFFADKSLSCITEERDVLSAETKLLDQSFIYIKKSSNPRIEPGGTSASTVNHVECWPFRTTLCFLLFRKFAKEFSKLHRTPFYFNLQIRPLCPKENIHNFKTMVKN